MLWCGCCYEEHGNDKFPKGGKPSGGDWEEEAEKRYKIGRSEDNLINNFQCDKCHLRKIPGRDPD